MEEETDSSEEEDGDLSDDEVDDLHSDNQPIVSVSKLDMMSTISTYEWYENEMSTTYNVYTRERDRRQYRELRQGRSTCT